MARKPLTHNEVLRRKANTSTRACVDRIVRTYNRATADDAAEGAAWYADAYRFAADLAMAADVTIEHAAVTVAHLSPRTTWKRNKRAAADLLLKGGADYALKANLKNARRALASGDPLLTFGKDAHKTYRFAQNILGNRDVVTVDVWAARVALGRRADLDKVLDRVGVYAALEHAYRVAAMRLGVDPVTVQATTWIVARNGRAQ